MIVSSYYSILAVSELLIVFVISDVINAINSAAAKMMSGYITKILSGSMINFIVDIPIDKKIGPIVAYVNGMDIAPAKMTATKVAMPNLIIW